MFNVRTVLRDQQIFDERVDPAVLLELPAAIELVTITTCCLLAPPLAKISPL